MAAGDHTRAWWPKMLQELQIRWSPDLTWVECTKLCQEMTILREEVRAAHGIYPLPVKCRCCGGTAYIQPAPISIRSLLFALNKSGYISCEELDQRDRDWRRYQKLHLLNAYGGLKESKKSTNESSCLMSSKS